MKIRIWGANVGPCVEGGHALMHAEKEAASCGELVHLEQAHCIPKPAQDGVAPVLVGGHSEGAAARPDGSATGSTLPSRSPWPNCSW